MRPTSKVLVLLLAVTVIAAVPSTTAKAAAMSDSDHILQLREDGSVRKLVNADRTPNQGTAEEIARTFLVANGQALFDVAPTADKAEGTLFGDVNLVHVRTKSSLSARHVWMQAEVDGVPVHQGYVVTHVGPRGQVLFVTSDVGPVQFDVNADKALIDAATALERAARLIGGDGLTRTQPRAELLVVRLDDGDHLAWRTETPTYNPYGDWEIFIDANTGAELKRSDLLVCIRPEEKPLSIAPPVENVRSPRAKGAAVTGSGEVFIANPLNDHPERYSWREFEPQLLTVTDAVSLTNLDGSGLLVGPWVEVFNSSGPRANEPSLVYVYDPTIVAGNFQEVNVYYHINEFQEYFQNTLGISNARARVTDCYAHQGSDDNSDYSPSQDRIRYGDGGVDDSDDGEIVLHEYGHAVHNDIVPGFVYAGESGAISEGFGDYFGATYGNNPLVGEWDAVSYNPGPPPYLRRTDTTKHYPEDIVGQVHSDGEIISAAWWDFRNLVGQEIADQVIIEGMFYTGTSATFQDFADGMVAADQVLYGGTHVGYIFQAFGGRGIGPTYLLDFNHMALGDNEDLIGPYPVVATITHTSPIGAPDAVKLYYRYDSLDPYTEVVMNPTGNFDEWGAEIPGPGFNATVEYYMTATDDAGITSSAPTTAPADVFSFFLGPDAQFPVITHTPVRDQPLLVWPAAVNAMITDNGAIASATVSYMLNGVPQPDLTLVDAGGGMYSVAFPEAAGSLTIGDVFEYTITAVDGSSSANTSVDGPHTFSIIDALGVVLILDDDLTIKTDIKYDDDKQVVPPHMRDEQDKGASAANMATILTDAGWVVSSEPAATSDPATWPGYSFVIISSGANTSPVADAVFRTAVEDFVAGGGKVLSEGGEVAYDAISFPGYPSYADNVLHGFDWDGDNSGPMPVVPGQENHPIMTSPHTVASSLALNYSGFGDQDSYKHNPDAYAVLGTTDEPLNPGVMVYDDNANPTSAQIVHYAFNFAVLTDPTQAAYLLENTALFLTATEAPGTATMSGSVELVGAGDFSGVTVSAEPGGFSAVTAADGSYQIEGLYGGTYTVTATIAGYGGSPQVVEVPEGGTVTGVDFVLAPITLTTYCETPALAVPDNTPAGVSTQLMVTEGDMIVDITADIDLTHTWKGDLILELTSPEGTTVRLHNRTGSSADNIQTNYDDATAPDGPGTMDDFTGESPVGMWTLFISDNAGGDVGTLNQWCLNVTTSATVVAADTPVLQVSQIDGGRELSWEYTPSPLDAFHVYRRVAGDNAVRLTGQPLTSTNGQIVYRDTDTSFEAGTVLYYSLRQVRGGTELGFGEEIEVTVTSTLPTMFALKKNYPNPFNPITNISFDLPRSGRVSLRVYDVQGRLVRTLVDENLTRAAHTYRWDGSDESGRRVASGVYYYRVQTEQTTATGKMMLVK